MQGSDESPQEVGRSTRLRLVFTLHFFRALITSLSALSQNKARFCLFYLSYNIDLLTFVKKLALICKKTSFIHSLQVRAKMVLSLPARAEWRHWLLRASVL